MCILSFWTVPVSRFCIAFLITATSFAFAENTGTSQLDLSRLDKSEQGEANAHICLATCGRNSSLDERYERSRYDQYYASAPNPDEPDCVEISCVSSERAADIRSICRARLDNLSDDVDCVLKCWAIGETYSASTFDDNLFKTSTQNRLVRLCNRFNSTPFADFEDTCPEIFNADGLNCSIYSSVLESDDEEDTAASIRGRASLDGASLDEFTGDLDSSRPADGVGRHMEH